MIGIGPSPFEFNVHGTEGALKWQKWLRGFEIFLRANKLDDALEKCNWLLYFAGEKVQDIYYSLPETKKEEEEAGKFVRIQLDEYTEMKNRLTEYFAPKQNITFERHMFRKLKQEANESISMFEMRLRAHAELCDFGDQLDSNIRDQITEKCSSNLLRRKILERDNVSFDEIMKMARSVEAASSQEKVFNSGTANNRGLPEEEVCKIETRGKNRFSPRNVGAIECNRCGIKGHKALDLVCPAKGKICSKCKGKNQKR